MPEETVVAAPAVQSENGSNDIDYNTFTQEELQNALTSGDLSELQAGTPAPEPEVPETKPETTEPAPEGDALPEAGGEVEAEGEPEAPAASEEEPVIAEEAAATPFVFTPDADDETYLAEREKFFEEYDVDPAVQFMFDRDQKIIEALKTETQFIPQAATELQEQTLMAMEQLVTRQKIVKDGQEVFVPNTQPMLKLLGENYPHEVPYLAEDFMGLPSQRYRGMTLFQEYIKDYGGLDDEGMETLERFLDNGGRTPVPSYVPRGIDPRYTEAFYRDPERPQIEEALSNAYEVIYDEYQSPQDRETARQTILGINRRLDDIQYGIDSRKNEVLRTQQQQQYQVQQVQQAAKENYVRDVNVLLDSFSDQLAKKLDMFDPNGAGVTATAYGTMIINALADDEWAGFAQDKLRKYGVEFNWKQGRTVMDQFWDIQHELAEQEARGASPAETAITQKRKANVIKEIKQLQLDALGKIGRVAIKGAGISLKQKVEAAPKRPASRRKITAGEGAPVPATNTGIDQYDKMTAEEIRSRIGELRNQLAGAGIPMTQ